MSRATATSPADDYEDDVETEDDDRDETIISRPPDMAEFLKAAKHAREFTIGPGSWVPFGLDEIPVDPDDDPTTPGAPVNRMLSPPSSKDGTTADTVPSITAPANIGVAGKRTVAPVPTTTPEIVTGATPSRSIWIV